MTRRLTCGLFVLLVFLVACNTGGSFTGTGRGAGDGGGGGGGGGGGPFLLVADSGNNRVLQYTSLITGQSAVVALGQISLLANAVAPVAANTLLSPSAVIVDSGGNAFVSDTNNCRILKFLAPLTTNESASSPVLGQANNATSCAVGALTDTLGHTGGIALDGTGNLWVADTSNNRVVKFAAANLVTGQPDQPIAVAFLGQVDANSAACNRSVPAANNSLCAPTAVAFDTTGNLWVVDSGNSRVLEFIAAQQVTNGTAALALGQPSTFCAANPCPPNQGGLGQGTLNVPTGMAFDTAGNAWVADNSNNRVLMFPKGGGFATGELATVVLGQTLFTLNAANQGLAAPTANTLSGPDAIVFDSTGRAIVTDSGNNRTLVYSTPLVTNEAATIAIGQPDLAHGGVNNPALGATSQFAPKGLFTTF